MNEPGYLVGVYCRLSKEDRKNAFTNESESIENQKLIINNYLQGHPEFNYVDTYADDGCTGLTYQREDFERLLDDLAIGRINTIITKDQSRFGREQIQTLQLLTLKFKENNIRYIAVNDGIDTFVNPDTTTIQLKAFLNDYYSADNSRKVRMSQKAKRERGDFIGSFAPYGYIKDPKNHNKFLIDEPAAAIVRRIFELFMAGYGQQKIARMLNAQGILCPSVYKKEVQGYLYTNDKRLESTSYWTYSTVRRILKNEVYIGNMIQHKIEKVAYNSEMKKVVPCEKWCMVKDTHEGIISREKFHIVQDLLAARYKEINFDGDNTSIFTGIFYCGDCGRIMSKFLNKPTQSGFRRMHYKCSSYSNYGKGVCTIHSISDEVLKEIVLKQIKESAIQALSRKDYDVIESASYRKTQNTDEAALIRLRASIETFDNRLDNMLFKLSSDDISQAEFNIFRTVNEKKKKEAMETILSLENRIANKEQVVSRHKEWIDYFIQYKDITELNREIVISLIERIEIYEDKSLKIAFRFRNPIEQNK